MRRRRVREGDWDVPSRFARSGAQSPILMLQVYYNLNKAIQWSHNDLSQLNFLALAYGVSACLWLVDTVNAGLSYCLESRWLENRTRSIDLTLSGWAVCLLCYEPMNQLTSAALAFGPDAATNNAAQLLIPNETVLYVVKSLEILFLGLHIFVDTSLGLAVANITFKHLQTRGPYGIVRHPGVTTKLLLWFVTACGYVEFWTPKFLLGYLGWATLYVLRALTEERHLSQHAEYRDYRTRVRYRFIPGLI